MKQIKNNLDKISKASLSQKQSVRTTFKLSETCIQVIDSLIKSNNLKPKELFDQMCENKKLTDLAIEISQKNNSNSPAKQIRKTFVISTRVKRMLNKLAKDYELSRDLIFENLVLIFKALLERYDEEEKQQEKEALKIISDFCNESEAVEEKLIKLLDDSNPILERFGLIVVIAMNLVSAIESKLSNDIPIEPDNMSQS